MGFIVVYITHESEAAAYALGKQLVEERLAACANAFPIRSAYHWQGTIEEAGEWVVLVKTVKENWDALRARVSTLHTYNIPCIMKFDVEANEAYERWIRKSVIIQDPK